MFSFVFLIFILCNYKYASLSLSLSSILSQTLYLCLSVKILTLSHSQSLCHSAFRDLSFSYMYFSFRLFDTFCVVVSFPLFYMRQYSYVSLSVYLSFSSHFIYISPPFLCLYPSLLLFFVCLYPSLLSLF